MTLFANLRFRLAKWSSVAGVGYFRQTLVKLSLFAKEQQLGKKAANLAANKVEGLANKEYAAVLKDFSEAEKIRLETEFNRTTISSKILKERTEARLAVIRLIDAELELHLKLKEAGVGVRQDAEGNLVFFPDSGDFDRQTAEGKPRLQESPGSELKEGQSPRVKLPPPNR